MRRFGKRPQGRAFKQAALQYEVTSLWGLDGG